MTSAAPITLQDNPRKYGRWEARVRIRPYERGALDYRNTVELIPESEGQRCAGRTITVANLAAYSRKMSFGVDSARAKPLVAAHPPDRWHRQQAHHGGRGGHQAPHHLVLQRQACRHGPHQCAAVPRVPLTMRITMEGKGDREMNRTMTHMDWMRGFSLNRGTKTKNGGSDVRPQVRRQLLTSPGRPPRPERRGGRAGL